MTNRTVCTKRLALVLLSVALMGMPLAAASEPEPSGHDAAERLVDVLTIDATTGRIVEASDNDAPETNIKLTNLPRSDGTFRLLDAHGRAVFTGAPPTTAQSVEFPYTALRHGLPYTVWLDGAEATTQVLAFTPTASSAVVVPTNPPSLAELEPVSTAKPPEINLAQYVAKAAQVIGMVGSLVVDPVLQLVEGADVPEVPGVPDLTGDDEDDGGGSECWYDDRNGSGETKTVAGDSETQWTALHFNHAPYDGSSTSTVTWTSMVGAYVFGAGYSSSMDTGVKLDLPAGQGGRTKAIYQLAQWTEYRYYYCGADETWHGGGEPYFSVTDWEPEGARVTKEFYLEGASRYTDSDDSDTVWAASPLTGTSYRSVRIDLRYKAADHVHSGGGTFSVSSKSLFEIDASLSFGGATWSFEAFRGKISSGSGTYYEYTMPAGTTYIDYLGNEHGGWAFCRPDHASC